MKTNQKGSTLVIVLVTIIITILACGIGYLGIRAAVTGDGFFAPFESKEDDDERSSKKSKKDDKESYESDEDKDENDSDKEYLYSKDGKKADKVYNVKIDGSELLKQTYKANMGLDIDASVTYEYEVYVKDDEIISVVYACDMKDYLEEYYNAFIDKFGTSSMSSLGVSNYEDFKDYMNEFYKDDSNWKTVFQTVFGAGLENYVSLASFDDLYAVLKIEWNDDVAETIESNFKTNYDYEIDASNVKEYIEGMEYIFKEAYDSNAKFKVK